MSALLRWLQETGLAEAIDQSSLLTGLLSAAHLLGLTLLVGGAVVAWLRLTGLLLRDYRVPEITRPIGRGMLVGLFLSIGSGILLFAPRASSAAANSTFQLKMLLLLCAVVFQLTIYRLVTRADRPQRLGLRLTAAVGPMLWFGVAVAGSVYILLE